MSLAEERTEQYIRFHLSDFFRIDVLEILSHLPCLTAADQDSIRAYIDRRGNRDSVWKLFDHLWRRTGWVTCLITALRKCELTDLADIVANVYASNQTRFHNRLRDQAVPSPLVAPSSRNQQVLPNTPPQPSTGVPGPHPPARGIPSSHPAPASPDTTYNGYPEEQEGEKAGLSHTAPIQDTQPPKKEVTGVTPNPAHSGDTSKKAERSHGHASFSAPAPTGPGEHHRASGGSGDSPPGPLSPSVSFVARSSKKVGPASGPRAAPSPDEGSSPSAHRPTASSPVNENQLRATSPCQGPGLPSSREPPTKSSVEVLPSTLKLAGSPQPGPVPSGREPPPQEDETEPSKPGLLMSCDNEPYSGGSERLLCSGSAPGSAGSLHISPPSRNLPEENDYSSVTSVPSSGKPESGSPHTQPGGSETPSLSTFELCIETGPVEYLLGSISDPTVPPGGRDASWGVWLGSAVAAVLFSVALAVLLKRIQK